MSKKITLILTISTFLLFMSVGCTRSNHREINIDNYKTMFEISLSSGPDFIVVIDQNSHIGNIIFLNDDSLSLVDLDIEGRSISDGVLIFMQKLWDYDYFDDSVTIKMICYDNTDINSLFYQELNKSLVVLGINSNIINETSDLKSLSNILGIEYKDDKVFLKDLSEYSNKIINGR